MGAPLSFWAMLSVTEIARYQEGPARSWFRATVTTAFSSTYDDYGKTIIEESRIPVDEFVIKGQGPWPWFDLGDKRAARYRCWTRSGWAARLDRTARATSSISSSQARSGTRVIELLAMGADPDPVDPLRRDSSVVRPALACRRHLRRPDRRDADAARRIELSARGERFTTILHEIVRRGRTVALNHALAHGVDPGLVDSEGATALHVRRQRPTTSTLRWCAHWCARAPPSTPPLPSGTQPIELAAG